DFARTIFTLPQHLDRYIDSLGALFSNVFALHDWGLLLIAALTATFFARKRMLALAIILPMLALYAGVFAVTTWELSVMTGNLAPRVLTHLLGPIFFLLSSAREVDVA
ncbi:MAG: hypothetical protein ACLGH0_12565, partial [Thermoanaerobaculia bacterium]